MAEQINNADQEFDAEMQQLEKEMNQIHSYYRAFLLINFFWVLLILVKWNSISMIIFVNGK